MSSSTTHIATVGAIAFSGATLVLCLGGLFAVWNDMQDLWMELDKQMDTFNVIFRIDISFLNPPQY